MVVNRPKREHILTIITVVLITITALASATLPSRDSHAESAAAGVTVGSACTMTADVKTAHTDEVPAGSSKESIGSTELKTVCNDNGGFAIYAVGYSNDEFGNNKMISVDSEFNTGTATSGSNSNWSMKLSQVTTGTYATTIDGGFDDYAGVPNTFTKVAHRNASTDEPSASTATGSTVALTYKAFIASTQTPGDYTGKVKFTLVHPDTETPVQPQTTQAGKICYYPNGGNVEGTMGCQTVSTSAKSATLLASNFSREGYGFAGWSTTYDYSDPTGFLGPQEYITFDAGQYTGNNNGLSLYARWIKSAGNLQGWTGCSALQQGSVTALTDQRDNNTYAVARLADGNCWMIENLRLKNTADHNSDGTLSQGYNSSFIGLAEPEAPWANNSTDANSLYTTEADVQGKNTISGSNQGYRFPRYNNVNTPTNTADRPQNPTSNSATNSTSNAGMYSYGNYYTWAAAIADTTNYTTNNQSVTNTSICPSGWRLPQGGDKTRIESDDDNDFWNLTVDALNGGTNPANYDSSTQPYYNGTAEAGPVADKLRSYPNNFVYSGDVSGGSVDSRGSNGRFWSSTAVSSYNAYYLYLYSSYVIPGTSYSLKHYGWTVRCVAPGV